MRLRTFLPPAALLAAGTVPAATPPAYAAETCHGQRATVVGVAGRAATGTAGRDVVVTNGASSVAAGGGDDLVCVTETRGRRVTVSAGAGDDVVLVGGHRHLHVRYDSGLGSDTYRSEGVADTVHLVGDGDDAVSTGRGRDRVVVRDGGPSGSPRVLLGDNADTLTLRGDLRSGWFDGGGGQLDSLQLVLDSDQPWTLDNVTGLASAGGEVRFRWAGFFGFGLSGVRAPAVSFIGSDRKEVVDGTATHTALRIAAGAGNDFLFGGEGDDVLDGGPGYDYTLAGGGTDQCLGVESADECEVLGQKSAERGRGYRPRERRAMANRPA